MPKNDDDNAKKTLDDLLKPRPGETEEERKSRESLAEMMDSLQSAISTPEPSENSLELIIGMATTDLELPGAEEVTRCLKIFGIDDGEVKVRGKEIGGDPSSEGILPSNIEFGSHIVNVVGIPQPAPQELMEITWQTAHVEAGMKKPFLEHKAHFGISYRGESEDPKLVYRILFAVVGAFMQGGCLGVLNPQACNFLPAMTLQANAITEDFAQMIAAGEFPPYTLTNFLSLFVPEGGTWVASRGHHVFGIADFAMFVPEGESIQMAHQLMGVMFQEQMRGRPKYKVGDTAAAGPMQLRFGTIDDDDYRDFISGPGETLLIEVGGQGGRGDGQARSSASGPGSASAPGSSGKGKQGKGCLLLLVGFVGCVIAGVVLVAF